MNNPNQRPWFKAKRYGYGWYPGSWQGWGIMGMYGFSVAVILIHSANNISGMTTYMQLFILTAFLIIICESTGEPARWRWGDKQ